MPVSATDKSGAAEAGAPDEIEVTPAMIAAGAAAFYDRMDNDGEVVAFSVFKAMASASPTFGKAALRET